MKMRNIKGLWIICLLMQVVVANTGMNNGIVDRGSLRSVIIPKEDIRLSSQSDGVILEYYKQEGERLEKGEPLIRLDDRMERAEVERAEANLQATKAEYDRALKEYNRIQVLHEEKIASDKQFDDVVYQLETSKSREKQALAALELAKVQQEYKLIRSPINGIFFKKNKSVGESVNRLEVVARVVDAESLEMVLYCSPQLMPQFKVGETKKIKLLDGPHKNEVVESKVVYYDTLIDAASGTFRVKLALEPSESVTGGIAGMVLLETP